MGKVASWDLVDVKKCECCCPGGDGEDGEQVVLMGTCADGWLVAAYM